MSLAQHEGAKKRLRWWRLGIEVGRDGERRVVTLWLGYWSKTWKRT